MKILGFNAYIHDTAAALIEDGELVAFAEQERFDRIKHSTGLPVDAIRYCLDEAGIDVDGLDAVAFYWDPWAGLGRRALQTLRNLPRSTRLLGLHSRNWRSVFNVRRAFRDAVGYRGPFHHVNHYLSHAAANHYSSGLERSATLVVDGNGEIASSLLAVVDGKGVRPLSWTLYPHSLGLVWCTVTQYLGYLQNQHEGKVMGLSSYGRGELVDKFRKVVWAQNDGRIRCDLSYFDYYEDRVDWFSPRFVKQFGPPRKPDGPIEQHHIEIACALQQVTEEILLELVEQLVRRSGLRDVTFGGGVALNCVANGKIAASGLVDSLHVQPAASDAGAAYGAALYTHIANGGMPPSPVTHAYYGPQFDEDRILAAFRARGIEPQRVDSARVAAEDLAAGRIVGWFQGRMEIGPRALGNRSILTDPRPDWMKDRLNNRVKHREMFRPFAPSVPLERAEEFFDTGGRPSPFMLLAVPVREQWRDKLPAITHVDGTARLQTVERADNPLYHELLTRFGDLSGVPVLLNTSFNVAGEPIVCTPDDAVACYLGTEIDVLIAGPFRASKPEV
ncbi:MAG: carbamoyltransferase C-terminal domain-containing protein [Candidatus Alcyoniella australis]|nr:carbamoyltransferase C-terminal domain-containing protein [Candidatus Alcyoniella australis]